MAASSQVAVIESIGAQPLAPPPPGEFRLQSERVEKLAAKLEKANDPETRAAALDLLQSVMEMHGMALNRMLQQLAKTPEGEAAVIDAVNDDLVSAMLLLHGLHPDDIETRVLRGIEKVRPYLKSHGGDVELSSVHDGIVHLVLHGSCGSCPSSSLTLKTAVEDALFEAAPDIVEIKADNAAAATSATSNLVMIQ
jgi:Fe-S cluster biogenesis protein NfuA